MSTRWRSMAVGVGLFTVLAVSTVWGLSQQLRSQLRTQTLELAQARAQQLADAMGGQIQAVNELVDSNLLHLREHWLSDPQGFEAVARQDLDMLPPGMASHVSVVDAAGQVFLDVPAPLVPRSMSDRAHFKDLRDGEDRLMLGEPVKARRHGRWVIAMGRPILRDGRFEGAIYILLTTDYLARTLSRLQLDQDDFMVMVHRSGRIIACSHDNLKAMGQSAPPSSAFLLDPAATRGAYREASDVAPDGVARAFGWQRNPATGTVVAVGLAEAGVTAPLVLAQQRAYFMTALLTLVLAGIGAWIVWMQWRLERGQEEMLQSREQVRVAQELAQLGHWEFDARTREMRWSDEVYRIFGQDRSHFQPNLKSYWAQVSKDEKPRLKDLLQQAAQMDLDDVHRINRPDGNERFVRLICRRPTEPGSQRFHGTIQDVTELHQTQRALEQLNAGLEQRVRSRTRQLQTLNKDLESFTYSVSHDLRTPLRSIHGFASLLKDTEGERLSDEGKDFLFRIQEASRRMGMLINDLLSMAQHSRAEIKPEWVDLSALAQSVATELERADPHRKVHWDIAPQLRAQADPVLMQVVLQNLLGNAWKYTSQVDEAYIRFYGTGSAGDGQMGFCVSDNGAGFDMSYADQLFQPFKRLHTLQQFEGTGIGLATVARVLQRHGGSIRGEGAVGRGATFHFSLPIEPLRQFNDSGLNLG
ncbi:MAG: PAS domain S-box protein [Hydrogenophaga sp.]|nr:PAS domain S-box protein [Hydrogenophaga sp.]